MESCNTAQEGPVDCSIVVPLYNEAEVVDELYDRLTKVMSQIGLSYELVLVELRRNFGQTPALAAGFDHARGVDIHDLGTTFKAYRCEVIEDLNLYGEMHRFIPALLSRDGVRIAELPIKNIERPHGTSNYGIGRTFRVALDLVTLRFLLGYATRPLHFFGKAALYCFVVSCALGCYLLFDKLYYKVPILGLHGPLAMLTGLLILIGFGFVSTGLIGELISRVYFEATQRKIYAVRKVYRRDRQTGANDDA
ncbi:MAG: hypothetical protein J7M40_15900 [Planctomycetes bacterium]|nr:hypothetical protein [Planctomycetota bacterium]